MFDKFETNKYLLSRGWLESVRLDTQHRVSVRRTSWLLHPHLVEHIEANLNTPDFRVADVACGTGIFALELHERFPTIDITALDQSSEQFPASWTIPSRVQFDTLDLLEDIPDEYIGAFDVIHVRFVSTVLFHCDRDKLTAGIRSMLKPGGWLQWQESHPPFFSEIDPNTLKVTSTVMPWTTVTERYTTYHNVSWLKDLDEFLRESGFEEAAKYWPPVNRAGLQESTNVILWTMAEGTKMYSRVFSPEASRELKEAFAMAQADAAGGKQFGYHLIVATGRKPGMQQ